MEREWTHGPVVAGAFYPGDPEELREAVAAYLDRAEPPAVPGTVRGLIVPHAGYIYSGPVAATAYALLEGLVFEQAVLVGPSHFHRFDGVATLDAAGWRTPLGTVPVRVAQGATPRREAFGGEHCLEVQLPFIQAVGLDAPVVPLLTGLVRPAPVSDLLNRLVGDGGLLLVSTDLSHYESYETAQRLDTATADAVVSGDVADLPWTAACGLTGLQAAVMLARRRGWTVDLVDLRNSGDTAGERQRVVGYGAFVLTQS